MKVTHCVILAAGRNTRLDTGKPKSLIEIGGCSLLERHLKQFKKEGCKHFCIVTGHNPEPVGERTSGWEEQLGVSISLVHNDRFDLENGYSVSCAEKWVRDSGAQAFFLTMGDHIFEEGFITSFTTELGRFQSLPVLSLAVDVPGAYNGHIDVEDVTKVVVDKGHIRQIGKLLSSYNRYDTGLFALTAEVFDAFRQCFEDEKYTISDMVLSLAAVQKARSVDMPDLRWNDVDNELDLEMSRRLFAGSSEG